jgi:peroxiredoxin Q/BCP
MANQRQIKILIARLTTKPRLHATILAIAIILMTIWSMDMTSVSQTAQLKVGDKAPAFSLHSYTSEGGSNTINLSDFHGKKNVILAFYPKDDTPGCTKEMCSFSEDLSHFTNAQTQVLGISCDSISSHEKFTSNHNLKLPLLADEKGEVGKKYGAVAETGGNASRVLFVIDKQGVVRHIINGMPTNSELLEIIKGLK